MEDAGAGCMDVVEKEWQVIKDKHLPPELKDSLKGGQYRCFFPKFFLGHLTYDNGRFLVGDQVLTRGCVLGTVTTLVCRETTTLFDLDDGTGIISCVYFENNLSKSTTQKSTDVNHHPVKYRRDLNSKAVPAEDLKNLSIDNGNLKTNNESAASKLLLEMQNWPELREEPLCIGDLVHIYGRLNIFKKKAQFTVEFLNILNDPNAEASRIFEVEKFNEDFRPNLYEILKKNRQSSLTTAFSSAGSNAFSLVSED